MGSEQKTGIDPLTDLSALAPELRTQDRDRYLATLFAPADCRDGLFALYAFDHEIAKVRQLVREPMAGLIRLQWWREALGKIEHGKVLAHPVAEALSRAVHDQSLDVGLLETAIQARERELEDVPPRDMAELRQHFLASHGGIVRASVKLLGGDDAKIMAAADELGQCLGFLEAIRLLEKRRGDGRLWLPNALLQEHALHVDHQLTDQDKPKIQRLLEALATMASDHLREARKARSLLSRRQLPAFLPGTLAERRLANIRQAQHDPLAPARLLWCWLRGSF